MRLLTVTVGFVLHESNQLSLKDTASYMAHTMCFFSSVQFREVMGSVNLPQGLQQRIPMCIEQFHNTYEIVDFGDPSIVGSPASEPLARDTETSMQLHPAGNDHDSATADVNTTSLPAQPESAELAPIRSDSPQLNSENRVMHDDERGFFETEDFPENEPEGDHSAPAAANNIAIVEGSPEGQDSPGLQEPPSPVLTQAPARANQQVRAEPLLVRRVTRSRALELDNTSKRVLRRRK
jgi:hypothetical protein